MDLWIEMQLYAFNLKEKGEKISRFRESSSDGIFAFSIDEIL